MVVYIKWRKLHHKTWGGWGFDSLTEWWQFLRLGLPGFLMLAFEWWSFEISAIVVGTIDETQLAIHAVLIQYGTMFFMVSSASHCMVPFLDHPNSISCLHNLHPSYPICAGSDNCCMVSFPHHPLHGLIPIPRPSCMCRFH